MSVLGLSRLTKFVAEPRYDDRIRLFQPDESALWLYAQRHPQHMKTTDIGYRLQHLLLDRIGERMPVLKGAEPSKFMTVLLGAHTEQGDEIEEHAHEEHTFLWYPAETFLYVGREPVKALAGDLLHLAPGTPHSVPKVFAPRLSVAMLIAGKP